MMSVVRDEKFQELLKLEKDKRRISSGGFLSYCEDYCSRNDLVLSKHHIFMAHKLERAMTTPNYRLMIKMPPGHAKSTYSSLLAPTYYLGRFPKKIAIMTTHTQDFSDDWGRSCRRIISGDEYQYYFDTELTRYSSAADRFELTNGSKYFGAGILGNLTGKRANLLIGDDWLRGIKDADSEVIRESIWKAYVWDLKTRLSPGGSIILIGTPWHEDDHFGRIMLSNDKEKWDVIELPALAAENDPLERKVGEPLWPDYITLGMLEDVRDSLDKKDIRMWNSLYQLKPTIETGDYFKKEWIDGNIVNLVPSGLGMYGASDYAVSDGAGDWTVHITAGYDSKNDEIYITDVWRERTVSDVWVDQFIDMAVESKVLEWAEEQGQIIQSVGPYIEKEMARRRQFIYRKQFTSSTDKPKRARSIQAYMARRKVKILNASWTDVFVKELLSFPSGKHDDQVDALSLLGRMFSEMRVKTSTDKILEKDEFRSNMIMLPGINEDLGNTRNNSFRKI